MERYVRAAFTDSDYMLGMFPGPLQDEIRKSCDNRGQSPIVGLGPAYLLWDGGNSGGIHSLYYGNWSDVRQNKRDDWIVICVSASKKDYRQTTWKWFHVTAEEYKQWFAALPASFRCSTQLIDLDGEEVACDSIEIGRFGADRKYPNLLWCVPLYVNNRNADWFTPELRLVRSISIDTEDAARIASLRLTLERGVASPR